MFQACRSIIHEDWQDGGICYWSRATCYAGNMLPYSNLPKLSMQSTNVDIEGLEYARPCPWSMPWVGLNLQGVSLPVCNVRQLQIQTILSWNGKTMTAKDVRLSVLLFDL